MTKKILKWMIVPAVAIASYVGFSSFSADDESTGGYCWGTYHTSSGIAICDGAAYNCTHPC